MIYAVDGGCFVLAPCIVISQEMFDMLCDTPEKAHLRTHAPIDLAAGSRRSTDPTAARCAIPWQSRKRELFTPRSIPH